LSAQFHEEIGELNGIPANEFAILQSRFAK